VGFVARKVATTLLAYQKYLAGFILLSEKGVTYGNEKCGVDDIEARSSDSYMGGQRS
jgi:hypothetical protein